MEYINIGYITGFHGIKGEVKVKSVTDFNEERFIPGLILTLRNDKESIEVKIDTVRFHKDRYLVKFVGYNWLNDVELLKGYRLTLEADQRVPLKEDEYYVRDLIGCTIFDFANTKLGVVKEVMDNPANDILVLDNDVMIPLVNAIVNEVDLPNKKVTLFEIDGLW